MAPRPPSAPRRRASSCSDPPSLLTRGSGFSASGPVPMTSGSPWLAARGRLHRPARDDRMRVGLDKEVVVARKFLFVCAGLLCLAPGVRAQVAVGTVLTENAAGYPYALVVMDNGDVYWSDLGPSPGSPQLPWGLAYNIFTAGGPASRVIGLGGGVVLTAAGGTYRLGSYAIFEGIIDHPTGQSFVTIGSNVSKNGRYIYAVTDAGVVYRCGPSGWENAGTLPIGPTPSTRDAWGSLKSRYR